jgi:hypothetical protein
MTQLLRASQDFRQFTGSTDLRFFATNFARPLLDCRLFVPERVCKRSTHAVATKFAGLGIKPIWSHLGVSAVAATIPTAKRSVQGSHQAGM